MTFYSFFYLYLIIIIISTKFSLLYMASMDSSFYIVQKLKELPYWNKGFLSYVYKRVIDVICCDPVLRSLALNLKKVLVIFEFMHFFENLRNVLIDFCTILNTKIVFIFH